MELTPELKNEEKYSKFLSRFAARYFILHSVDTPDREIYREHEAKFVPDNLENMIHMVGYIAAAVRVDRAWDLSQRVQMIPNWEEVITQQVTEALQYREAIKAGE